MANLTYEEIKAKHRNKSKDKTREKTYEEIRKEHTIGNQNNVEQTPRDNYFRSYQRAINNTINNNNDNNYFRSNRRLYNYQNKKQEKRAEAFEEWKKTYEDNTGISFDKALSLEKAYGNYDRQALEKVKEHYSTQGTKDDDIVKWVNDRLVSTATAEENKNRQAILEKQIDQADERIHNLQEKYYRESQNNPTYTTDSFGRRKQVTEDYHDNPEYLEAVERINNEKDTLETELDRYKQYVDYSTEDDYEAFKLKGEGNPNNAVRFYRTHTDEQANEILDPTVNSEIDTLHHESDYTGGGSNESDRALFRTITDKEADNYSYLLGKYGQEAADNYLQEVAQHTDVNGIYEKLKNAQEEGYEHGIKSSAKSVALGLATPFEAAKNIFSGDEYRTADDYALANEQNYLRQGTAQRIADEIGSDTIAPFLYNTAMSTADNFLRYAAAGAIGGIASDLSAAETLAGLGATTNVGKGVMRGMMAGQVMDQSMSEALERGLSNKEAVTTALISAFNEELFETLSIEKLSALQKTDAKALKDLVKNVGKQFATEGSEEVFTDIGNAIADDLINGENSEIKQNIENYKNKGLTEDEARQQAAKDFALQLVESGLSGGLSGAGMGVGASINTALNIKNNKKFDNLVDTYKKQGYSDEEAEELAITSYTNESANNVIDVFKGKSATTGGALNKAIKSARKLSDRVGQMETELNGQTEDNQVADAETLESQRNNLESQRNNLETQSAEDGFNAYRNLENQLIAEETANNTVDNAINEDIRDNIVENPTTAAETTTNTVAKSNDSNFNNELSSFLDNAVALRQNDNAESNNQLADEIVQFVSAHPNERAVTEELFSTILYSESADDIIDYKNNYFGTTAADNVVNNPVIAENTTTNTENIDITPLKTAKLNGEQVEVIGTNKNNVVIRTANGQEQTVKNSNLETSEGTQAAIEQAKTYGKRGSQIYLGNLTGNIRAFTGSFNVFYNAGKNGIDFGSIQASNFSNLADNNRDAVSLAYEIFYAGSADNAKNKKVGGLVRNEYRHQVNERLARTLNDIGKALGVTIELDGRISHDANGVYEDGRIHISLDTDNPVLVVFSHEFTHRLKQTSPKAYQQYEDYVIGKLKESGHYKKRVAKLSSIYGNQNVNLNDEVVKEEIAANATEMFLMDEDFINSLVKDNRTLAKKVVDMIKQLLDDIKALIDTNYTARSIEAKVISENTEFLKEARDLWLKAIEQQNKALIAKENAKDSESRYSFSEESIKKLSNNEYTIRNMFRVAKMEPVYTLYWKYNKKDGSINKDLISGTINTKKGNIIYKELNEIIDIDENSEDNLKAHLFSGRYELIESIKKVIENGYAVDYQADRKVKNRIDEGKSIRKYDKGDFVTIAAPVVFKDNNSNKKIYIVGVSIKITDDGNHLYTIGIHNINDNKINKSYIPGALNSDDLSGQLIRTQNATLNINSILKDIIFVKKYWKDLDSINPDNIRVLNRNSSKDTYKYSLKEDSEGRELSEQQQEYFKDSKAVDENGKLLVLYHGTKAHYFTKFNTNNGTWLSTDINYSAQYAKNIPLLFKKSSRYSKKPIYKYDRISKNEIDIWKNSIERKENELAEKAEWDADSYEYKRDKGLLEFDKELLKGKIDLYNKQDIVKENDKRIYELYANIHNPLDVGYTTKEAEKEMPEIIEKMSLTEKDKNSVMKLVKPLDWVWEIIRKPEFINIAKKYGYDSIIAQEFYGFENPPTTICVFNSNQIKNVDNLNPTDNPDIRFSLKEESNITNNDVAALTSRNQYMAEEVKDLEDILNSGKSFFKVKQNDLYKIYDELAADYKINGYSKKQFAQNVQILFDYISEVDKPDALETSTLAMMIANDMIEQAGIKDTYMSENYEKLEKDIKGTRFRIADQDKADLDGGYDAFRKKYFGKLTLANDGIYVDSKYQELHEVYPELFPEGITHPAEQLTRIGEVIDMFDATLDNIYGATKEESAFIIGQDIIQKVLLDTSRTANYPNRDKLQLQGKLRKSNTNLKKAKKDIKDDYEMMLKKVKALESINKRLERENTKLENQMGKQMKDFADYAADEKALKKAGKLERENQRLKARFARQQVAKLERKYSQERKKNLEKIKKLTNQLSRSLLHPDKTHYVPKGLVASMLDVARAIDLDSGYRNPDGSETKIHLKLMDLQRQYRLMQEDGDYAISSEYNETVDKAIGRLVSLTSNKRINELMDRDIEEIADIMTIINHELKIARDLINSEKLKDVKDAAEKGITQIKAANRVFDKNKKLKNLLNRYTNNMLSPLRVFRRLENYATDGVMSELGHMLEEGERKTKVIKYTAEDMLADLTKDKEAVKQLEEFRTKKITYNIGGKEVTITPDMRVALYLHSLNEQNMNHITGNKDKDGIYHGGGVIIPNYNKAMLDKNKLNVDSTEKYTGVGSVRIFPEMMKKIVADMTDYEKMIADLYQKVNAYLTEELNATTMDLYGFKKATVENYFPIIVDKSILNIESEGLKMDKTLESFGFLKERVNSAKPIYLEGVWDALNRQINQSSLFCGMAIPTRNFSKVYNYTVEETGSENGQLTNILKESEKAYGSYMTKYIDNLKADLAQARDKSTSEIARVFSRGKMATGVLTGNLSVVIKQMTSYPTAAGGVLDFQDLVAGLSYQGQSGKDLTKLINKYSPYLRDRDTSTIAGINIKDTNKLQRTNPKLYYALTGWIEATDKATVRRLWYASENYVKRNYDYTVGSDEFYQEVARVWEDTLRKTQPIYDTLSRPEDLRQTGEIKKWLMMFKTQAFQNVGILVDSYGEWHAKKAAYDSNKENVFAKTELKEAQKQFKKAVESQLIQVMVFTLMTAIADALKHRPDDWVDEETGQFTAESFLKNYGLSIISNSITQLAYGDIIKDLTLGPVLAISGKDTSRFDTEIIPVAMINDTLNEVLAISKNVNKLATVDKNDYADTKTYKNVKKGYIDKIIKQVEGLSESGLQYGFGLPIGNVKKLVKGFYENTEDIINGENPLNISSDKLTYNSIYLAYKEGDAKTAAELSKDIDTSKLKTQMVNRLKEEDTIKQAADYRYENNTEEYQKIIDAYVSQGFDESWVLSAINSFMNKKYETTGSVSDGLYNASDLVRALDISTTQGNKVANQIYQDKLSYYKENGETDEDAKKKALSSIKSTLTSKYKDKYVNGTTHDKVVIRDLLISVTVNGEKLFTMEGLKKWEDK